MNDFDDHLRMSVVGITAVDSENQNNRQIGEHDPIGQLHNQPLARWDLNHERLTASMNTNDGSQGIDDTSIIGSCFDS